MAKHKIFISILSWLYIIFMGCFLFLYLTHTVDEAINLYSNIYGIIPLIGGIYGLFLARHWGGFKSAVGKAITFLSLGLVTWGIGMIIWLYYNIILGVSIPYPSFADAAFIISWPLWTIGAAFLSIATGAKFGLRNLKGKAFLLIIPVIIIVFSYYFLVIIARQGIVSAYDELIKTFFDLAYPVGDVVILTTTILIFGLSYRYFSGIYKTAIYLILAGFVVNYFADFTFSYTTTIGAYYNGSLPDALFVSAMTLLSAGIALLDPSRLNQKDKK